MFHCRCKDCRNHFELRKATGAVAIQFNAEAHSLIVLVSWTLLYDNEKHNSSPNHIIQTLSYPDDADKKSSPDW